MRKITLAIALGLGITGSAMASEATPGPYGALLGTYVSPDEGRDAGFGLGGQILFGLPVAEHLNLEFTGFGNHLHRTSDHGTDAQYGGGLDFVFPILSGSIQPFLLAGGGGIYEQLDTSAKAGTFSPYLNFGGGVLYKLTKKLSARAEARYLVDYNTQSIPNNDHLGDGRFSLGLQYSFYTPPAPVKAAPPPPPPPAAPLPPPDSDGDGVIDSQDQCPNTPAGVKVDAKGCPLDTDGDGVPDYLDQCPGTPKGFKVDSVGCIIEQTVILRTVNFEFNKDVLTSDAKSALDQVAAGLASQPKLTVQIDGHTDSVGTAAYNLALSKKRAESVRAYLVSKGIDASRLAAEGYGKTKPIASNDTEAGRAENRRVEFQVLNKPLAVKVINKKGAPTKK